MEVGNYKFVKSDDDIKVIYLVRPTRKHKKTPNHKRKDVNIMKLNPKIIAATICDTLQANLKK